MPFLPLRRRFFLGLLLHYPSTPARRLYYLHCYRSLSYLRPVVIMNNLGCLF